MAAKTAETLTLPFLPDLTNLRYMARAITPPGFPRRFDTHFFALFTDEAGVDPTDIRDSRELEDLRWIDVNDVSVCSMPDITGHPGDLRASLNPMHLCPLAGLCRSTHASWAIRPRTFSKDFIHVSADEPAHRAELKKSIGLRWSQPSRPSSAVGIAIGLGLPLLSIILEKRGISSTLIGLNTAMAGVAAMAAAPITTKTRP